MADSTTTTDTEEKHGVSKKLRFFLVTDNVESSTSKDKAYLNKMKSYIQKQGYSCKVCGVGSNMHTQAKKYGCKDKNDVWVCVVGGVCAGTLKDMASNYARKSRGNAYLVWAMRTDYIKFNLETTTFLKRAWDDNFSPSNFKGLPNPTSFMRKNDIGRVYGETATEMAQNLINNSIGHPRGGTGSVGLIFDNWGEEGNLGVSSSSSDTKTTTETFGFDVDNPFKAYIKIVYSIDDPKGDKKTILFDFTSNAPDLGYSFTNDEPVFVNDEFRELRFDVYEKLQQLHLGQHKFYLREIWLEDYIPLQDKNVSDNTSNVLYDEKTDHSSYKMLISECGMTNQEAISSVNLALSGKSLLDGVKECVEKSKYLYKVRYGKHRYLDHIDFYKDEDYKDTDYEYSQGYNGNILEVTSVNYAPLSTLRNNSITVYKCQPDSNDESTIHYNYSQSRIPRNVLQYGEFTTIQSASDTISDWEAYYLARTNKEYMDNMEFSYSLTVVGYDGIEIMDWAKTFMNRKFYNDVKRVNSIEVSGDVTKRPMVRTTLGLGAIDKKMRVQRNLIQQRKQLKTQNVEVTGGITFNNTFDFLEE